MNPSFFSLSNLQSLDDTSVQHLRSLGINNLGDLLAFQPFRSAQYIKAAKERRLRKEEIVEYLDESARDKNIEDLLTLPARAIKGIGAPIAGVLEKLGIGTIEDLANYQVFAEAEEIVTRTTTDENDPYAPPCVLPTCKKFTRNTKSYVSFFRGREIRNLSVLTKPPRSLILQLFNFYPNETKVIYLGYAVSYHQDWIYTGVHLGEPQGSVNLLMAQDTQVSMLDWRRAMRGFRTEDTRVAERLASTLFHQRAVDEVARATAEEHQHGGTSSFGANAATAGTLSAAGAIIGGVGGGISGGVAGLSVDALTGGATMGLGTLTGAAVGTAVGSVAGSVAGSLIGAGGVTLGVVETDAGGDREVFAESGQNIQQRTIQNSSSIRSFWSNIILQNAEDEQQRIKTDRITNHNRIHALNAIYFEVLNSYRVNITPNDFTPILFLPYKPIFFNEDVLRRYWWLIRKTLSDPKLVLAIDEHFLTLNTDPSPAEELGELPGIDDIKTKKVTVEVNLDGSAMQDLFEDLIKASIAFAVLGPIGGVGAAAALMVENFLNADKRKKVKVKLITTGDDVPLDRSDSSDSDPNFIGTYSTDDAVAVHTLTGIEISNTNEEFTIGTPSNVLGVPVPHVSWDLNELAFEGITAKLSIKNKESFSATLPNLGSLEGRKTLRPSTLKIGANSSKTIAWDIASRLNSQFEGIDAQREELDAELSSEEQTQAKIRNLLGFLNANKFGFTRFILQNTEQEQVIKALEEVHVGNVDLSAIASTVPIGFCGNHIVLPLRKYTAKAENNDGIRFNTYKLELHLSNLNMLEEESIEDKLGYFKGLSLTLGEHADIFRKEFAEMSVREKELVELMDKLKKAIKASLGAFDIPDTDRVQRALAASLAKLIVKAKELQRFIQTPVETNQIDGDKLENFYTSVESLLAPRMGKLLKSDEVSLPSPAIFMEPVLSHSKGAELYDMRRNSHYEILPSPEILAVDPNLLRSRDISLTPNTPEATLTIQPAPQLPLPTSINTALTEAGKLNLDNLITTNAGTLNTTLSNLSSLVGELAKASAQLTGDAQKQALSAATDVAKQIGTIVDKSLNPAPPAKEAARETPREAAPAPKPLPPQGQQEKAEVRREVDRINKEPISDTEKKEKKETVGAPITPNDKRDYQMSILFLDQDNVPYPKVDFRLGMSFFELNTSFELNGGGQIEVSDGEFLFPETIPLTKGRKGVIRINADILGAIIPGTRDFVLPDSPDIVFKCKMLTEIHKVKTTSVKSAVDEAVRNSAFGVSLNPILQSFLNAGVEFPFKIFKISADGGQKTELNFKAEYNRSSSETDTDTTEDTTEKEFEVVIPKNGWIIDVV